MASEKIAKIAEEIQGLSLLEASELVKLLEEKLGVSAAAPVAVAAAGAPAAGGAAPAAAEEKTEFDIVLKDAGSQKIPVIKVDPRNRFRSRFEGSERPSRIRTRRRQEGRDQGRSRRSQEEIGRSRRDGRNQIRTRNPFSLLQGKRVLFCCLFPETLASYLT